MPAGPGRGSGRRPVAAATVGRGTGQGENVAAGHPGQCPPRQPRHSTGSTASCRSRNGGSAFVRVRRCGDSARTSDATSPVDRCRTISGGGDGSVRIWSSRSAVRAMPAASVGAAMRGATRRRRVRVPDGISPAHGRVGGMACRPVQVRQFRPQCPPRRRVRRPGQAQQRPLAFGQAFAQFRVRHRGQARQRFAGRFGLDPGRLAGRRLAFHDSDRRRGRRSGWELHVLQRVEFNLRFWCLVGSFVDHPEREEFKRRSRRHDREWNGFGFDDVFHRVGKGPERGSRHRIRHHGPARLGGEPGYRARSSANSRAQHVAQRRQFCRGLNSLRTSPLSRMLLPPRPSPVAPRSARRGAGRRIGSAAPRPRTESLHSLLIGLGDEAQPFLGSMDRTQSSPVRAAGPGACSGTATVKSRPNESVGAGLMIISSRSRRKRSDGDFFGQRDQVDGRRFDHPH